MNWNSFKFFGKDIRYVYDSDNDNLSPKKIRNIYIKDSGDTEWTEYNPVEAAEILFGIMALQTFSNTVYGTGISKEHFLINQVEGDEAYGSEIFHAFISDGCSTSPVVIVDHDLLTEGPETLLDGFWHQIHINNPSFEQSNHPRIIVLATEQIAKEYNENIDSLGDTDSRLVINGTSFDEIRLADPEMIASDLSSLCLSAPNHNTNNIIGLYRSTESEAEDLESCFISSSDSIEYYINHDENYFNRSNQWYGNSSLAGSSSPWDDLSNNLDIDPACFSETYLQSGDNNNIVMVRNDHFLDCLQRIVSVVSDLDEDTSGYIMLRLDDLIREFYADDYDEDKSELVDVIESTLETCAGYLLSEAVNYPLKIILKSDILLPLDPLAQSRWLQELFSSQYISDLIVLEPKLPLSMEPANIQRLNNVVNSLTFSELCFYSDNSDSDYLRAFNYVAAQLGGDNTDNYLLELDTTVHPNKIKTILTNYTLFRIQPREEI